jgi:hypothetical protein
MAQICFDFRNEINSLRKLNMVSLVKKEINLDDSSTHMECATTKRTKELSSAITTIIVSKYLIEKVNSYNYLDPKAREMDNSSISNKFVFNLTPITF